MAKMGHGLGKRQRPFLSWMFSLKFWPGSVRLACHSLFHVSSIVLGSKKEIWNMNPRTLSDSMILVMILLF